MGADSSKYSNSSFDWEFVGRENDMKKARELVHEYGTIGIYGIRKIGKSRFLVRLFQEMDESESMCLIKDFEPDDISSPYMYYNWFNDLLSCTGMLERAAFKSKYPGEKISCANCKHCEHNMSCEYKKDCLEQAENVTLESLKSCSEQLILFFDNVDKLLESDLKDCLLHFIHELNEKCPNVKLVFCSNYEANYFHKSYGKVVLGPLEERAILELIYLTTESPNDTSASENDDEVPNDEAIQNYRGKMETVDELFKQENTYFTPENKVSMETIAHLCEGHPLAAIISGTLLTEDEGLLTPAELLEILVQSKQNALSQKHCPSEDRLDICDTPMQKLKFVYRVIFDAKTIGYVDQIDEFSVF